MHWITVSLFNHWSWQQSSENWVYETLSQIHDFPLFQHFALLTSQVSGSFDQLLGRLLMACSWPNLHWDSLYIFYIFTVKVIILYYIERSCRSIYIYTSYIVRMTLILMTIINHTIYIYIIAIAAAGRFASKVVSTCSSTMIPQEWVMLRFEEIHTEVLCREVEESLETHQILVMFFFNITIAIIMGYQHWEWLVFGLGAWWVCQKKGMYLGDGSKPWYLVNPKIAGKWMFIPLKMYL